MKYKRLRITYLVAFLLILCTEILIGAFVRDNLVRPYVGDVLVAVLIYCAVRAVFPKGIKLLSIYVFIFALIVELLQLVKIVDLLGIPHKSIIAIMVGTSFSFIDIICYAVGCAIAYLTELIFKKHL